MPEAGFIVCVVETTAVCAVSALNYSRASSIAIPWPPLMHSVTSPSSRSWRSISSRIFGRDRGPGGGDRVPQGDRATVRVDLLLVEAEIIDHGERLRGERLVELDHADLLERAPGALEHLAHRRHRPDAHDRRIDAAARVGQDPRPDRSIQLGRARGLHQNHGGAGVVHARGVAGGHRAVGLERGRELGHRLGRGVLADVLVASELRRLALCLHGNRNDLIVEAPRAPRRRGTAMRLHREGVLALVRDPAPLGQVLGRHAHVDVVERVGERPGDRVLERRLAHSRAPAGPRHPVRPAAHRLRAAGQCNLGLAGLNRLSSRDDCLHTRSRTAG